LILDDVVHIGCVSSNLFLWVVQHILDVHWVVIMELPDLQLKVFDEFWIQWALLTGINDWLLC
jgi:hypothetical protein